MSSNKICIRSAMYTYIEEKKLLKYDRFIVVHAASDELFMLSLNDKSR